ncbi:MAG TPA: long-chain fatty acid--CoA ligase [Solirubrobacteraceae bacterium]|nr:long-chain fatty acid--CoA ligase [Solirubrobacteraceae bacterium]
MGMLEGLMQDDFPLSLQHARRRMRDCHPAARVMTLTPEGTAAATFGEVCERVDRLARVLKRLGIEQGDRVGTFAWNNQRHFELYMAVPCIGAVLHTLNIRLFAEQLTYIVNHAEDRVIFVDDSLVGLLEPLAPTFGGVRHFIVMGDGDSGSLPNVLRYEELLAESTAAADRLAVARAPGASPADSVPAAGVPGASPADSSPAARAEAETLYPELDERQAASLCYTSGTTGNPKGVLYSHRSICLHATAALMADNLGLSRRERVLAVVPMFHVNAWGLPYAAALCGADLVLPDRFMAAEPLARAIERERPTVMGCVPTIFADLLRYADTHAVDLSSLTNAVCGGSAVPRQLMKDFQERHGVVIHQGWGMTETSPVVTFSDPSEERGHDERYWDERALQGKPLPWTELRLIGDDGEEVPWDGESTGEVEVRGPWIARRYFNDPSGDEKFDDGWLRTGDIAAIDDQAFVRITDRSKDVIKSGGEWISSVELENELMAHPEVLEAAVIAKPDERWAERPLCCVVLCEESTVTAQELVEHLRPRVAKWWLPDEFAFVAEVPKTSVGKFDKKVLRAQLAEGALEGRVLVAGEVRAG